MKKHTRPIKSSRETEKAVLKAATNEIGFVGHYIPKSMLTFDNFSFSFNFYVGPVMDPFILRLDVLLPVQSVTDLGKHTLIVKDQHGHEPVTPVTTVNN